MQTHTYPNGFRLIYEPALSGSESASVQVFCDIGSIHEPLEFRGAAHFIEHMCFTGTPSMPDAKQINNVFDMGGASVNAYTSNRNTCYYATGLYDQVETFIKTFSDMLLNSTFKQSIYEKEHAVVREELTKDEDDPERIMFENADKILYAGSPYAFPVDTSSYHRGPKALNYNSVFAFYKTTYVPERFILSVCSKESFATIKHYVDASYFVNSGSSKKTGHNKPTMHIPPLILSITPQNEPVYKIHRKSGLSATYVSIGFRTCPYTHADKYPLKVLKNIIGGSMSSRLFVLLRGENGLSYSSDAICEYFEHLGDFKMHADSDSNKVFNNSEKPGLFVLLTNLISDLIQHGVTEEEVHNTKKLLQSRMRLKVEDSEYIAEKNGKQLLLNIPYIEHKRKYDVCIKPVTVAQVNACIRRYFCPQTMVVSVVSNSPEALRKSTYEKFVKQIKWMQEKTHNT